ncbi:hypothetical protein [Hyalangium sp.]|uniref:hypothetical protein n=1 Tax=Hyalangium sp. TaxID=2028555 RepID=UPI002D29BDB9|nr:hypothetical protein [Hyalangium sp.]HYH99736.1 hypothetical protein [Hyalangium sp.]
MSARACAVALCLTLPCATWAWQGWCRSTVPGGREALGELSSSPLLRESICAMKKDEEVWPSCQAGRRAAQGAQLGEHARISAEAMALAQIPSHLRQPVDLVYYTTGQKLPDISSLPSLQPAAAGSMRERQLRRVYLAEFSELPDVSHSVSDYVLGNERCAVPNLRSDTPERIDSCHQFEGHMGTLNASHWPPLSKAYYRHYHELALAVARRCAQVKDGLKQVTSHTLSSVSDSIIQECEREALALEAFASHFLQDAWSTGHMWNRWGFLVPPESDQDYMAGFYATAMTGIIHGTRSVTDKHDQACMPGPFDRSSGEPIIRYRHGSDPTLHAGGGDLYLESCTALYPEWSVKIMEQLGHDQRAGMLACAALGFREVYLAGPKLGGDVLPPVTTGYGFPGGMPAAATDDVCWNMRLTNLSMRLSLGTRHTVIDVTAFDLADPQWFAGLRPRLLVSRINSTGREALETNLSDYQQGLLAEGFRMAAVKLATRVILAARDAPSETTVATDDPELESFNFVPRSTRWLSDVEQGRIPLMDEKNRDRWKDEPTGLPCSFDHDCHSGHYCDKTLVTLEAGRLVPTPSCVPTAGAVLRAFRSGEAPYWCKADDGNQLARAVAACKQHGGGACSACQEMLEPHLRNACGPDDFKATPMSGQHSLCDLMGVPAQPVYAPYVPGDPASLSRVSLGLCTGAFGATPLTTPVRDGTLSNTAPPPTADDPHGGVVSRTSSVCGGKPQAQWWRFRHEPLTAPHEHVYAVRVQPDSSRLKPRASDVAFEMFRGPGCAETDRIFAPQQLQDSDGDGVLDTILMTETVPAGGAQEICLRVRGATPETYWVRFKFAINPIFLSQ